ncbi:helix-turn-helix transcriptional regulator [Candidatus Woesearchaeota archaeon]|nr:helix-turn-helix transcriptional regulator [Candidatus Woesearchaeota archaeon]
MQCLPFTLTKLLGKKWNILILQILNEENITSFNQLRKQLKNITGKILSARLYELEKIKLILKTNKEDDKRKKYFITQEGKELLNLFDNMKSWAAEHRYVPETCLQTKCKDCKYNCTLLPLSKGISA